MSCIIVLVSISVVRRRRIIPSYCCGIPCLLHVVVITICIVIRFCYCSRSYCYYYHVYWYYSFHYSYYSAYPSASASTTDDVDSGDGFYY